MDYKRIYDDLIAYRQKNILLTGYIEKHHIIPRSLGGTNDKENLVALSGREHYIAHLLLARFNRCSQTAYALIAMQMKPSEYCERPCIKNGRMYEWARKEFAKYISKNAKITSKGERNSQYGTCWICNIELQENKKVNKDEPIPEDWIIGRNKWIPKRKRPIKGNKGNAQAIIKANTILKVKNLKDKYQCVHSHSLFKQISKIENISVRTLYSYWNII